MAETKKFTNIKPFTLDLSKPFRDKYSNLTYKKLKAVIIKRIYGIKEDRYVIHEMPLYNEFIGRLKVNLKFCGRNRRLNFETVFDEMYVKTILEEPVKFKNFKNYNSVSVSYFPRKLLERSFII